jgi:hypothetical protein
MNRIHSGMTAPTSLVGGCAEGVKNWPHQSTILSIQASCPGVPGG